MKPTNPYLSSPSSLSASPHHTPPRQNNPKPIAYRYISKTSTISPVSKLNNIKQQSFQDNPSSLLFPSQQKIQEKRSEQGDLLESSSKIRELRERKRVTEDMLSKMNEERSRKERETIELEKSVKGIEEKAIEMRRIKEEHSMKKSEAQGNIIRMKEEFKEKSKELEMMKGELNHLRNQNEDMEYQLEQIKKSVERMNEVLGEARKVWKEKKEKGEEMRGQLKERVREEQELAKGKKESQGIMERISWENKERGRMCETLKEEIKNLNRVIELSKEEKEDENKEVNNLKEEIKNLNRVIELSKEEKEDENKEVNNLKEEIKNLNRVIELSKEEKEDENKEVNNLKEEIKNLNRVIELSKEEKEDENKEVNNLKEEIKNLNRVIELSKEEKEDENKEVNNLKEEIKNLNRVIELSKEEKEDENKEVNNLKEEIKNLNRVIELSKEEKEDENKEVNNLKEEIKNLNRVIELSKEEKEDENKEVNNLKEEIKNLNRVIELSKEEKEDENKEVNNLKEEIKNLNRVIELSKEEKEDENKEVNNLKEEIKNLNRVIELSKEEKEDENKEVNNLKEEIKNLNRVIELSKEEKEDENKEVNNLKEEIKNLNRVIELSKEEKEDENKEVNNLKEEIKNLNRVIELSKEEKEDENKEVNNLKEEIKNLNRVIELSKEEKEDENKEVNNLKEEIKNLNRVIELSKEEKEDENKEVNNLKEEIKNLNRVIELSKEEKEDENKEVNNLKEEIKNLNRVIELSKEEKEDENKEVNNLKEEIKNLNRVIELSKEERITTSTQIQNLKSQISNLASQPQSPPLPSLKSTPQHQQSLFLLTSQLQSLRLQNHCLQFSIDTLKTQLSSLQNRLSKTKLQNRQLNQQNLDLTTKLSLQQISMNNSRRPSKEFIEEQEESGKYEELVKINDQMREEMEKRIKELESQIVSLSNTAKQMSIEQGIDESTQTPNLQFIHTSSFSSSSPPHSFGTITKTQSLQVRPFSSSPSPLFTNSPSPHLNLSDFTLTIYSTLILIQKLINQNVKLINTQQGDLYTNLKEIVNEVEGLRELVRRWEGQEEKRKDMGEKEMMVGYFKEFTVVKEENGRMVGELETQINVLKQQKLELERKLEENTTKHEEIVEELKERIERIKKENVAASSLQLKRKDTLETDQLKKQFINLQNQLTFIQQKYERVQKQLYEIVTTKKQLLWKLQNSSNTILDLKRQLSQIYQTHHQYVRRIEQVKERQSGEMEELMGRMMITAPVQNNQERLLLINGYEKNIFQLRDSLEVEKSLREDANYKYDQLDIQLNSIRNQNSILQQKLKMVYSTKLQNSPSSDETEKLQNQIKDLTSIIQQKQLIFSRQQKQISKYQKQIQNLSKQIQTIRKLYLDSENNRKDSIILSNKLRQRITTLDIKIHSFEGQLNLNKNNVEHQFQNMINTLIANHTLQTRSLKSKHSIAGDPFSVRIFQKCFEIYQIIPSTGSEPQWTPENEIELFKQMDGIKSFVQNRIQEQDKNTRRINKKQDTYINIIKDLISQSGVEEQTVNQILEKSNVFNNSQYTKFESRINFILELSRKIKKIDQIKEMKQSDQRESDKFFDFSDFTHQNDQREIQVLNKKLKQLQGDLDTEKKRIVQITQQNKQLKIVQQKCKKEHNKKQPIIVQKGRQ